MMSSTITSPSEQSGSFADVDNRLAAEPRARSWQREFRLFLWGVPILIFILVAIFGPILVPYDSVTVRTGDRLEPPGAILRDGSRAWLGTDQVGRDMLAQVLQGARISLLVGAATVLIAGLIGMSLGTVAGFQGGFADRLLMRVADI